MAELEQKELPLEIEKVSLFKNRFRSALIVLLAYVVAMVALLAMLGCTVPITWESPPRLAPEKIDPPLDLSPPVPTGCDDYRDLRMPPN